MSENDLQTVLDWAAEEGWNPGHDDAEAFLATDPAGFFLAVYGETPVAAISVVNHSRAFAFLGLYLCRPAYRGQGVGYALWQAAIAHAGGRTIGLDGVQEQQGNYAKSGFVSAGGTARYSGKVSPLASSSIRPAEEADLAGLVALEGAASGWEKPTYMTAWLRPARCRRTFVLEDAGRPTGFATFRSCRAGAKIGPLLADDEQAARSLIAHGAAEFGEDLIIDVPSTSPRLETVAIGLNLEPGFTTARMYRGEIRPPGSGLYAPGTLELG